MIVGFGPGPGTGLYRTRRAAAFSPLDLSPVVWVDFGSADDLYQDAAKATPVSSNNDPVGAAADKSGNGNDWTQSTTASKPTYKTAIQNGLSAAYCDGGDRMAIPAIALDDFYIAWAMQRTGGSWSGVFSDGETEYIRWSWNATDFQFKTTQSTQTWVSMPTANNWQVLELFRSGSTAELVINGVSRGTKAISNTFNLPDFMGYQPFQAYAGEYIIVDSLPDSDQRQQTRDYLNDRWAVY